MGTGKSRQNRYDQYEKAFLRRLGVRISGLRAARGFTQKQFAEKSGVHRNYVSLIETGQINVAVLNLRAVANALGITPSELLDFSAKTSQQSEQ